MWRGMEKLFHVLNGRNDARVTYEGSYYGEYLRYDDLVGPKGAPNVQVNSIKKCDGRVLYDATYTTDEFGRRITYPSNPAAKEKFLAFFGCSYVFGEGLNDEETLPWQVAMLAPAFRVYNYGVSGHGPQQMLAKLESGEFAREVAERSGIVVYVFIPHHVRRAIGSMRVATKWGRAFPNYELDAQRRPVRIGNFTTGRPALTRWYDSLAEIATLRFFGVAVPPFLTGGHLEFTARVIHGAEEACRSRFADSRFCVLLYPDSPRAEMGGNAIIPYLDRLGIEYLDFTSLIDMRDEAFSIKEGGHPTAAAHKRVAEALIKWGQPPIS